MGSSRELPRLVKSVPSRIGLVRNPADFDVELNLEGYKFVRNGNKFKAIQLSKLVLSYADEKTGQPLGEVLVSVSGGVDYRSNVLVDVSGRRSFVGLVSCLYP